MKNIFTVAIDTYVMNFSKTHLSLGCQIKTIREWKTTHIDDIEDEEQKWLWGYYKDTIFEIIDKDWELKMIRLDIGDYYTRKEVANLLKVKEPIVHKYAKQGKFREFKQHRNCSGLYPKQDIENFIKKYFGLVDLDQQSHRDNLPTTA
ncbi:pentapeptide repeat family protein [Campylobacter coli]|nr:pentapeptide repeat family protein [Campylobacter coli]